MLLVPTAPGARAGHVSHNGAALSDVGLCDGGLISHSTSDSSPEWTAASSSPVAAPGRKRGRSTSGSTTPCPTPPEGGSSPVWLSSTVDVIGAIQTNESGALCSVPAPRASPLELSGAETIEPTVPTHAPDDDAVGLSGRTPQSRTAGGVAAQPAAMRAPPLVAGTCPQSEALLDESFVHALFMDDEAHALPSQLVSCVPMSALPSPPTSPPATNKGAPEVGAGLVSLLRRVQQQGMRRFSCCFAMLIALHVGWTVVDPFRSSRQQLTTYLSYLAYPTSAALVLAATFPDAQKLPSSAWAYLQMLDIALLASSVRSVLNRWEEVSDFGEPDELIAVRRVALFASMLPSFVRVLVHANDTRMRHVWATNRFAAAYNGILIAILSCAVWWLSPQGDSELFPPGNLRLHQSLSLSVLFITLAAASSVGNRKTLARSFEQLVPQLKTPTLVAAVHTVSS